MNRHLWLALALLVVGFVFIGLDLAWALEGNPNSGNPSGTSDGATAKMLAERLYCDARGLLTGNIGLILGLVMVFFGLWSLVTGGGWIGAIVSIIIGAMIPSIPGLVEGFMEGLGKLLQESGAGSQPFKVTECKDSSGGGTPSGGSAEAQRARMGNSFGF